jgi:hypothetical protein
VHDLKDLFDCLDHKQKVAIRDHWNENFLEEARGGILNIYNGMKANNPSAAAIYDAILDHPDKLDFDYVLVSSKMAFAGFRYDYESRKPGVPAPAWFAGGIVWSARAVILQTKPEWAGVSRGWTKQTPATFPTP